MVFIEDEDEKKKGIETIIRHFEKNPARMMARIDSGSKSWQNTQMLKLTIREITGKKRTVIPHQ
jgi:hypothetical protein